MDARSVILERAVELLAASASGDISTRAVCEAAGVGQPVLYRLFGDKDGLLAAVADTVWDEYLGAKRAARRSSDPAQDLRDGWDNHTAFALQHPHAYRLAFASTLSSRPAAVDEAMSLLQGILDGLAVHGRLRMNPEEAARTVIAANSGIALALILRPDQYPDAAISTVVREATLSGILVDVDVDVDGRAADVARVAATTLRASLAESTLLTEAEAALMQEWLERIQTS